MFFSLIYANIYKIIAVYNRFTVYYYEESIQEEKKMKKCLKCGAELDDGANFCRYCGSSQMVDSAEAMAQGYYVPNGMSQDYYDPNGTAQGYYAPNDMAQGYYDQNGKAQG